jgi:hypothetical protein
VKDFCWGGTVNAKLIGTKTNIVECIGGIVERILGLKGCHIVHSMQFREITCLDVATINIRIVGGGGKIIALTAKVMCLVRSIAGTQIIVALNITNNIAERNLEAKFNGGTIFPQNGSCQSTITLRNY